MPGTSPPFLSFSLLNVWLVINNSFGLYFIFNMTNLHYAALILWFCCKSKNGRKIELNLNYEITNNKKGAPGTSLPPSFLFFPRWLATSGSIWFNMVQYYKSIQVRRVFLLQNYRKIKNRGAWDLPPLPFFFFAQRLVGGE